MLKALRRFLSVLSLLFVLGLPAVAVEEGVREQWGELHLILKEPVVGRTAVENGRRLAQAQRSGGGEEEDAPALPTAADCGLTMFTVTGSPAPRLRWADQNKLRIEFAPGSSPETEYRLVFKAGTSYLSGAPLETTAFSFRCKPVELRACWLPEHAGGAALLSSAWRDTQEAQQLAQKHEGLRVHFRRLRHVPMVGWVCTGTVPARLRPAMVADGFGSHGRVLATLLEQVKPEEIAGDTPLPQCVVALPERPLQPGESYELGVEAAPGSGFVSGNLPLSVLPAALEATLERKLVQVGEGEEAPYATRLELRFSQPIPAERLEAIWRDLKVSVNQIPATRQKDGGYSADIGGQAVSLHLRGLFPCQSQLACWHEGSRYHYIPAGCAQGLELEVCAASPLELQLTLPAGVQTRHGLALRSSQYTLFASLSPASPALTGNGGNLIAWSGRHSLRLPLVNVGEVVATAYRWEAEDAARLLPLIQHGMRDDTVSCEIWQRLMWMRRRAAEGLSTEGWLGEDARTEAERALRRLQAEREKSDPLREQALAEAMAYAPQALRLNAAPGGNAFVSRGEAVLDLDQLTGGQLRPGLYLISLVSRPVDAVVETLRSFGMAGDDPALACTADYLVQVTDMSLCRGENRLLVNSLATGQPLEDGQARVYRLPEPPARPDEGDETARPAAPTQQATLVEDIPALPVTQGEVQLPEAAGGKLLLLQRGEDYTLFSLWRQRVDAPAADAVPEARAELFCDRPLYRPGEVVHLRGVLRRPTRGGLALPRPRQGMLTVHTPNGELLESRPVEVDAYGALAADVTLPDGEENVAGSYRCLLRVEEEGRSVEARLELGCEVFRRSAFTASVRTELSAVAPQTYRVQVQAVDYNGSPVSGGKVKLEMESGVPMLDDVDRKGDSPDEEDWDRWQEQELVLDEQGRAAVSGGFAAFDKEETLRVRASVANEREEYVQVEDACHRLAPADFLIRVDGGERLRLLDARSVEADTPLPRAQEVELVFTVEEELRRDLPCGIYFTERQERTVARHRITVPAGCTQGVELRPYLEALAAQGHPVATLRVSGQDAEGRRIRHEQYSYLRRPSPRQSCKLTAEGRNLRLELGEPIGQAGRLHTYISSQGKLRHALVEAEAGARTLTIPLTEQEYGDICVTLACCGRDAWGAFTDWKEWKGCCSLPRPDRELRVELTLPEGARPGQELILQGRVLDAAGQPVKAALTLFAVDAGMMSIAPYRLPELATIFYRGRAGAFALQRRASGPCRPVVLPLPNLWSREGSDWDEGQLRAALRSVWPAGVNIGCFERGVSGALCRWGMGEAVRAAQPNFRWGDLLASDARAYETMGAPAPAPMAVEAGGAQMMRKTARAASNGEMEEEAAAPAPHLRVNFEPVALWLASLETGADGRFRADCRLPDTLTTYEVHAVALDESGGCFGGAKGSFLVNQPLMLTPGTPLFMSVGDRLRLPLTITHNGDAAGEWSIHLEGGGNDETQQVTLPPRATETLYLDVTAREEGTCTLRWTAQSADGADAVQATFPVRHPAPLLKEAHHLALAEGGAAVRVGDLLAADVATAPRGEMQLHFSTSPLLHLSGSVDFLLNYPYGCTEQRASALLPWLFHEQLSPFCPQMAMSTADEVQNTLTHSITQLLARQREDGGLSYWAAEPGVRAESCAWASAYAALVLTLAEEQGVAVPQDALEKLRHYLGRQNWHKQSHLIQYAAARARGKSGELNRILIKALKKELEQVETHAWARDTADLEFMAQLRSDPASRHEALLNWLRAKGKDSRHRSSWSGGWTLIALAEYLRLEPRAAGQGALLVNGEEHPVENKPASLNLRPAAGQPLHAAVPTLAAGKGTVYVSVNAKALPERSDYPGVTENGLQVTRVYEVKGADGQWREASQFKVGELVRVTLTCAKMADELEYFVLEDYLPACMEAVNPNVPGQAAGLADGGRGRWSHWFDHREYLADRVRGFCTRWAGRDVVNMSYYARVKRAGESTAPPAVAQLMYEPQTCGLSPSRRVRSE